MEDRLKFRIWDNKEKRYVEEYLDREIMLSIDGTLNACAYDFSGNRSIEDINKNNRFEVEFCTGLKDEKDKLIYEGDILKITDQGIDDIVKVYYENGMYCFSISPNSANLVFFDLSDNETTCEVIGNIHENTDLLGEE